MADCVELLASLELPERAVQIELSDSQVYDAEAILFPIIVGLAEVAEILGVSKQYVSEEARKKTGWIPGPVARVKASPLWLRDEIIAVAEARAARAKDAGSRTSRHFGNKAKADFDPDDVLDIGEEIAIGAGRFLDGA